MGFHEVNEKVVTFYLKFVSLLEDLSKCEYLVGGRLSWEESEIGFDADHVRFCPFSHDESKDFVGGVNNANFFIVTYTHVGPLSCGCG